MLRSWCSDIDIACDQLDHNGDRSCLDNCVLNDRIDHIDGMPLNLHILHLLHIHRRHCILLTHSAHRSLVALLIHCLEHRHRPFDMPPQLMDRRSLQEEQEEGRRHRMWPHQG